MCTHLICHCDPVLDAGVGNLGAVAMVVCRHVLNINGIATWFDRLTMSGYAPRNDRWVRPSPPAPLPVGEGSRI